MASSDSTPTDLVSVSGQKFILGGSPFTVVGFNAYWIGLSNYYSTTDIDKAFADIASTGATVVRTWGFNEVTTTEPGKIYYQSWSGSTPTINRGPTGLQNFDKIISSARAHELRLIVTLTNNWPEYGGMDTYVKQILGSSDHSLFYTDARVVTAFKNYVRAFVSRYVNESTILAWELANEPKCQGSTQIITNWISDVSAYIKSIDPNHLVAAGDAGFFHVPDSSSYPYQGSEGADFPASLAISTIDFGTFHLYPEHWDQNCNPSSKAWGCQWIADHATFQRLANKPVILEAFGVTYDKVNVYTAWCNEILHTGLAGDLIWQAGSRLSNGNSPDDGYAEYPDGPVHPIVKQHAADLKSRA